VPKLYKYEYEKAKDRAQERANREGKPFHIVISKRRFVQIGQGLSKKRTDDDWIFLGNINPKSK
jgi:hypothetical protein